jgi:hypothetical protein
MTTTIRVLLGAGLFLLGYYVGREVGRLEAFHAELLRAGGGPTTGRTFDADDLELRGEKSRAS